MSLVWAIGLAPTPGTRKGRHYIRVLPSAISHVFFGCTACDQFVQDGLAGFGAQYAPKALDILALGAVSTHDDCDAAIRHIHPFIEYATGDQFGVLPGAEALENRASFLGGSFIGNAGQAKAAADLIDNRVKFGEQNYLVTRMEVQKALDFGIFGGSIHGNSARLAPGEHGLTRFRVARTEENDLLLKLFGRMDDDATALQE